MLRDQARNVLAMRSERHTQTYLMCALRHHECQEAIETNCCKSQCQSSHCDREPADHACFEHGSVQMLFHRPQSGDRKVTVNGMNQRPDSAYQQKTGVGIRADVEARRVIATLMIVALVVWQINKRHSRYAG